MPVHDDNNRATGRVICGIMSCCALALAWVACGPERLDDRESSANAAVVAGDLNDDDQINVVDLQLLVNVLLGSETGPNIVQRADYDRDGTTNVSDLQRLVNRLLTCGGTQPVATDDAATTDMVRPVAIRVLDNDCGIDDLPLEVTVTSQPASGRATPARLGVIRYTPNAGFFGTDSFVYRIRDGSGDAATATVTVTVNDTRAMREYTFAWDPNPPEPPILGYRFYYGPSESQIDQLAREVPLTTPGFDPAAPEITLHAWNDLRLHWGDRVCLAVTAYNATQESPRSNVPCIDDVQPRPPE